MRLRRRCGAGTVIAFLTVGLVAVMNVTRILCPTDFSEASNHAVDLALAIGAAYKARIAALPMGWGTNN